MELLTNTSVKKILGLRGFFHDVTFLTTVLLPLKMAILNLEAAQTNLADCFIQLIKLVVSINRISNERRMTGFKNHCIKVINDRWISFDIKPYLLAYYLHPLYRGKYNLNKNLEIKKKNKLIFYI
jgi:hypothetical protein